MNRKQLIIAAMATVLSVSAANATSNISGITGVNGNGTSGSFNIDPAAISGDVGYRYYDFFQLGKGDIANLIYHGYKNGNPRDLNAFINLVQNQIDINGVVNTVRNGSFHPGHAIFISPNGMTVGASGVLNVGTLSVVTPTQGKFNELKTGYDGQDYSVINNISQMRNGTGMNYGGNAPVTVNGTVIARNGVDIRGSQVNIGGGIVNGYNGNQLFDGTENAAGKNAAQVLFESLVNTDGIKTANALNNGSLVVIKSGAGENAGINISGKVANLNNNAETAITNHGDQGLTISGTVAANNKLNIYNNNATGDLLVESNAVITSKNGDLSIVNKGNDLKIKNSAKVTTDGNLAVVNNGKGVLLLQGNAVSKGKTDIVNRGEGGTHISGNIGDINTTPTVRIVNEKGKLVIVSGNINAKESVSVRNLADGTGLSINGGTINAGEGVLVHNKAGDLTLNYGTINVTEGNLVVMNEGNGKLLTGASNTLNGNGNVAVKNIGAGGMELNGTITNQNENFGETAINNHNGEMIVNGTITNNGNMGIHNRENGTKMTVGAVINNEGKLKFSNVGAGGLTFDGTVNNVGDTYVYNDKAVLTVSETGKFVNEGNLYIQSRKESSGINAKAGSLISNEGGNLAIKHNGAGAHAGGGNGGVGLSLNGDIKNSAGETAINNYKGNAYIAGNIEVENGNLGIINRTGAGALDINATITQDGESNTVNIKNFGGVDMTVNGEITHNGRLNVLANESNLILGGKIHNTGKQMTYAAARANGDGIVVKDTFEADSNAGGTILIKNITGQNGLTYEGTMNATNGSQAEVYNKVGDMTVTGNITGTPAVILNTGRKLTVTNAAELNGDVKIVNKGTESADVAEKFKPYFREKVKK